jgi:glycerophosphoryl diester phosphodiesterase
VLGHRGAPRDAVENTLDAFDEAREQGADGIELDVHRSLDGTLVVHHDAEVAGFGILAEHDFGAIRAARPGIPTLDEVFDACAGMLVNVEVKNSPRDADFDPADRAADAVVELVRRRKLHDSVLVSSFHLPTIDRVRVLDPDVPTGYLVVVDPLPVPALEIAHEHGHGALHPHVAALGEAYAGDAVARAAELGIDLNVWTVNEPGEIVRLAGLGVHAIITDTPREARRALGGE